MTKDKEMDSITSKVIQQFFESGGGSESAHLLVRHQIESYNEFLDKKLQQSDSWIQSHCHVSQL